VPGWGARGTGEGPLPADLPFPPAVPAGVHPIRIVLDVRAPIVPEGRRRWKGAKALKLKSLKWMTRGRNREETAKRKEAGICASVFTPEDMLFFKAMKELH